MEILAKTFEFLSSLRSSFQLLAIKNKIKATEKAQENETKFYSIYFYENIKTSV